MKIDYEKLTVYAFVIAASLVWGLLGGNIEWKP